MPTLGIDRDPVPSIVCQLIAPDGAIRKVHAPPQPLHPLQQFFVPSRIFVHVRKVW
jgi:hypothetical protein